MKKIIAIVCTVVMLVSMLTVFASADGGARYELTNEFCRKSPYAVTAPTIDGVKDDTYLDSASVEGAPAKEEAAGASFKVWFQNDNKYLYVYAEIKGIAGKTVNNSKYVDLMRLYIDFYNADTEEDKVPVKNSYPYTIDNLTDAAAIGIYNGGQFGFCPNDELGVFAKMPNTALMQEEVKNGGFKAIDNKDGSWKFEARITLPDATIHNTSRDVAGLISRGNEVIIGVGYEGRCVDPADDQKYFHIRYNDADGSNWTNFAMCSDLILSTNFEYQPEPETTAEVTTEAVTTEAPTVTTEATTTEEAQDGTTESNNQTNAPAATTGSDNEEGGCGSMVAGGIAVVAVISLAGVIVSKKKFN